MTADEVDGFINDVSQQGLAWYSAVTGKYPPAAQPNAAAMSAPPSYYGPYADGYRMPPASSVPAGLAAPMGGGGVPFLATGSGTLVVIALIGLGAYLLLK